MSEFGCENPCRPPAKFDYDFIACRMAYLDSISGGKPAKKVLVMMKDGVGVFKRKESVARYGFPIKTAADVKLAYYVFSSNSYSYIYILSDENMDKKTGAYLGNHITMGYKPARNRTADPVFDFHVTKYVPGNFHPCSNYIDVKNQVDSVFRCYRESL